MRGSDPQIPVVGVYLPLAGGTMVGAILAASLDLNSLGVSNLGYVYLKDRITGNADGVSLQAGDADTFHLKLRARDSGVAEVEIARLQGAADPYFQATLPMVLLPVATVALPATPVEGMIAYDATKDKLTYRDAAAWQTLTPAVTIRKAADEAVNNSAVLQDDNHLIMPIAPNEVWFIELFLHILQGASATPNFQCNFTVPAGATLQYKAFDSVDSIATIAGYIQPAAAQVIIVVVGNAQKSLVHLKLVVANGANAGSVTLQWSQNVATAVDTKVLTNSCLRGTKLA